MALKFKNFSLLAKTMTFNSNAVKKLILDNDIKWEKPFSLSIQDIVGASSITCYRYSTNEPSAVSGTSATLSNGSTVYNEDVVYCTASKPGYAVSVSGSPNSFNGSNVNISADETITIYGTRLTAKIKVTINTGVASVSLTYILQNGTSKTETITSTKTVTAAAVSSYSWTATAQTGYTMNTSSGSGTTGTFDTTTNVSPTAAQSGPSRHTDWTGSFYLPTNIPQDYEWQESDSIALSYSGTPQKIKVFGHVGVYDNYIGENVEYEEFETEYTVMGKMSPPEELTVYDGVNYDGYIRVSFNYNKGNVNFNMSSSQTNPSIAFFEVVIEEIDVYY